MPSENRFNTVIIFDSIPVGELNTAKSLHNNLRDLSYEYSPIPRVEYHRIESSETLERKIDELRSRTTRGEIFPLLHIEAHGWEDGLALANNEKVYWENLKEMLIPLNIATRLNLMLVLASCSGGTFTKALRLADRAPIWGLIGPTESLTANQIQGDFGGFYTTLFKELSPSKALNTLNANAPTNLYYRTTAEWFFYEVWRSYRKEHCTPVQLNLRARCMYRKVKRTSVSHRPSIGQLKRTLVHIERSSFDRFRDTYFMCDIYPEHTERFQVTYEQTQRTE